MGSQNVYNYSSFVPSSSTPSTHRRYQYDVFLSFRVKDTLKNFTGHLCAALIQAGIRTFNFRDDHNGELPIRGNEISSELLKAIQQSRISIVVFSTNYASSVWCLDELVKIMDCKNNNKIGQLVIPVFYDVDPIDVRNQTGCFGDAFAKVGAETENKVERWRAALAEAANLSGWDLQDVANWHEAKFIQKIVGHVLDKVKHEKLYVAKHPIGLESRVEHLNSLLRIGSNDVRMVGIYGMSGIGKTTMAKAFYNSAFHLFDGCCFLANVQEVSEQPNGLVRLQEQLLSEILMVKKFKVANDHIGITFLQERLWHKRVLIILDDLDQLSQLERLAGQRNWFGLGSRIIITTKNEYLLSQAKVDDRYEVKALNDEESLILFCWHAFKEPIPLENYKELSSRIVSYAGGLPLALEVLGSSLLGRTTKEWDFILKKLQEIPPNQIQKKLRISFDLLDDDKVKDIFLDIACFFIGMDKEYVINIFDGCGFFPRSGITILIERCLLKIGQSNKIRMHDLVRDMGREVVREKFPYEPGKRSRLWFHGDAYDVLRKHEGSEAIEGVVLDLPTQVHLSTKAFAIMHKLRLLKINNVQLDGSFEGLFEELRWLCWHHCPLESLPSELHLAKLVALDMQHSNIRLWQGNKFLTNLKTLNLSNSKFLKTTPDFTGVPRLDELSLRFCSSLSKIDPSIGHLDKLIELNLGYCENLKSLPSSIVKLRSLENLYLDECSRLQQLPEQLGNIESLRGLHITGTAIKQLPSSIGLLKNLTNFTVAQSNRSKLEAKPWFSFFPFRILSQSPKEITFLPPTVSSLSSIKDLDLSDSNLDDGDIPNDLSALTSLRLLHLNGNNFCTLPSSLGQLCSLESFWLHDCKSLQSVLEFPPNLRWLDASNCTLLEKLPNLSNLKHLKGLELINCSRLAEIQGLEKLDCIEDIYLEGCSNLATTFENRLFQGYSERVGNCSIYLSRREIPHWFKYQGKGSSISFDVPFDIGNDFLEMTIWVDYVNECKYGVGLSAVINNKTNGTEWTHKGSFFRAFEVNSWVSHGPQPYTIKGGDKVEVSIGGDEGLKVEKCGIHLVYKPDIKPTEDTLQVITEFDGGKFVDNVQLKRGRNLVETSCDSSNESKLVKRLKLE